MPDTSTPKATTVPPVAASPAPSAASPQANVQPAINLAKAVAAPTAHVDTPPPAPIRPHGTGIRGLTLSRGSQLFEGRFGRMFRALPGAYTAKNLVKLAAAMVSPADPADPKDSADNKESGIPAVSTYFGQFIDHDLTLGSPNTPTTAASTWPT